MRSLDLFCGTKSFSKIAEEHGYETTTLDILERFNPSICCNIMDWDYKQLPTGYYAIVNMTIHIANAQESGTIRRGKGCHYVKRINTAYIGSMGSMLVGMLPRGRVSSAKF